MANKWGYFEARKRRWKNVIIVAGIIGIFSFGAAFGCDCKESMILIWIGICCVFSIAYGFVMLRSRNSNTFKNE